MTAGLPGAGIGGLFYLASSILLPVRSLWRRARGLPDTVPLRQQLHSLLMAFGIMGALWVSGWMLAFIVPDDMLPQNAFSRPGAASSANTVIPLATFLVAVGTLVLVLVMVEMARLIQAVSWARPGTNTTDRIS